MFFSGICDFLVRGDRNSYPDKFLSNKFNDLRNNKVKERGFGKQYNKVHAYERMYIYICIIYIFC